MPVLLSVPVFYWATELIHWLIENNTWRTYLAADPCVNIDRLHRCYDVIDSTSAVGWDVTLVQLALKVRRIVVGRRHVDDNVGTWPLAYILAQVSTDHRQQVSPQRTLAWNMRTFIVKSYTKYEQNSPQCQRRRDRVKDQVAIPNKTVPDVETTKLSYFSTGAVQRGRGERPPVKIMPPGGPNKVYDKALVRGGSLWHYRSVPPSCNYGHPTGPPKCKPQNRHCFSRTSKLQRLSVLWPDPSGTDGR